MGIKNGAPTIISHIRHGLYHKNAKNYNIYVDGELMRYRGMIEENLSKNNAEEAIAITSFDFLKRTIKNIEEMMGCRAQIVKVYMDGARVANKETNRPRIHHNVALIRRLFKLYCGMNAYDVMELSKGESELQMYLRRDTNAELNVFLTNDSDMISICYGHTPHIESENQFTPTEHTIFTDRMYAVSIDDCNQNYPKNVVVRDSCVWVNCGRDVMAIGFDFISERLLFSPKIFRTLIAFCKTDFTDGLYSESMIGAIMLADDDSKAFVNTLHDINEIGAVLQVLGLKYGGQIKRNTNNKQATFDAGNISKAVAMYIQYIETGYMPDAEMPRNDMALACRHYLYAMRNQDDCFTLKALQCWAASVDLAETIKNMRMHLGTFVPKVLLDRKRKFAT